MKQKSKKNNLKEQGITLVALVVTIIVLLILAGVALSLTVGNKGLFTMAQSGAKTHEEAVAKERLEIELANLSLDKQTKQEYNDQYMDEELGKQGIVMVGDIAIVDGWQFQIDRSIPKIIASIGKGEENEDIKIKNGRSETRTDYVNAEIKAEIEYEGKISKIIINGKEIEIQSKENNVYEISQTVEENGIYTILVKDEEDNYKIAQIEIKDITEDMEIWNAEDLIEFREKVNSGRTFENRTAKVMDNINLNGNEENKWTPIGTESNTFKGIFEGNEKTINKLYINATSNYQGLFGYTEGAYIQNVVLNDVNIKVENGTFIGGVVGRSTNTKIYRCGINGNIEGYRYLGGISGFATSGTIIECYNTANITQKDSGNDATIGNVSGIVGTTEKETEINYCYNTGNISGTGGWNSGIASLTRGSKINNCYNGGNVIAVQRKFYRYIGGIASNTYYDSTYGAKICEINNSYNLAEIKCMDTTNNNLKSVGGVIGGIQNGYTKIENSYNTGNITSTASEAKVGGICGRISNLGPSQTLINC